MRDLISVQEALAQQSEATFVDCSFYLPTQKRDAHELFITAHLPGARFFDINLVADRTSSLPHMMPDADRFAAGVAELGISRQDKVVVYDQVGLFSAARGWLTFKQFNHPDIALLNGGLPAWKAAGGALEKGPTKTASSQYLADGLTTARVASASHVRQALDEKRTVLDARPAGRFEGRDPEPREGLRGGHMPGAINLPHSKLLTDDGRLRPADELRAIFRAAGVDLTAPVTTSCGSGVTAAVLSFALYQLGVDAPVYDGSWAEWGDPQNGFPVVKSG